MTVYVKLSPNSGHLSITDKFFMTRKCLLFRGFTIKVNIETFFMISLAV